MFWLIYLLATSLAIVSADDSHQQEVLDYIALWDKNVAEALAWERPTYNKDFDYKDLVCNDNNTVKETYDFVIVGAGTGAVLSSRLAEIDGWRILVLEVGKDETPFSLIPGAYMGVQNSDKNYGYLTVPQKNACQGMKNNQCHFGKGRGLGGDTALNENVYIRGNEADYDDWEPCWKNGTTLKYFKKMENVHGFEADRGMHGLNGPLSVTYPSYKHFLSEAIINAHRELGYETLDYNGRKQIGTSRIQVNTHHGKRHSTNQAYLKRTKCKTNLVVKTSSLATKINLNAEKNIAVSVNYLHKKKCYVARARKEIIISAGTVSSPHLLMLSGIGPKEHLQKHNIPVNKDLPAVGQNMIDHPTYYNVLISTNHTPPIVEGQRQKDFHDYIHEEGRLAMPLASEVSFRKLDGSTEGKPDITIMHSTPANYVNPRLSRKQTNVKDEIADGSPTIGFNFILSHVILLNPESRGSITLKSANPIDYPLIDPNLLEAQKDVDKLVWGIKEALKLTTTKALQPFNARRTDNSIPPCPLRLGADAFWECMVRHSASGIYHSVGTCRMGPDEKTSVVNGDLLVHGFKNLRVVDASVIPSATSGHTNPVKVMIAEKVADDIKCKYSSEFFYV